MSDVGDFAKAKDDNKYWMVNFNTARGYMGSGPGLRAIFFDKAAAGVVRDEFVGKRDGKGNGGKTMSFDASNGSFDIKVDDYGAVVMTSSEQEYECQSRLAKVSRRIAECLGLDWLRMNYQGRDN